MNFLLIDDHPLFSLGFSALCESLATPASLTIVSSYTEALELSSDSRFNLIFIDLELPDGSGLDLLAHFKTLCPLSPCVIMSAHNKPSIIQSAINAGAHGFISKSEHSDVTARAIELILSGGMYVPKDAMSATLGHTDAELFTPKQLRILKFLAHGDSNKTIAQNIFLSEGTVRNYISQIFILLNVKNRSKAVSVARSMGILSSWD